MNFYVHIDLTQQTDRIWNWVDTSLPRCCVKRMNILNYIAEIIGAQVFEKEYQVTNRNHLIFRSEKDRIKAHFRLHGAVCKIDN